MTIEELKPCPFCGGSPEILRAVEAGEGAYVVQCSERICAASSKVVFACGADPREHLVSAWNRRDGERELWHVAQNADLLLDLMAEFPDNPKVWGEAIDQLTRALNTVIREKSLPTED